MARFNQVDIDDLDDLEEFEDQFDPMNTDRQARRKRKPKVKHTPKKTQHEIIEEIADTTVLESGFKTTYTPSVYEEGWLLESLKTFYDMGLITDILVQVKGGKEASVYRCAAHPSTGHEFLAAKVYRPRMFRNLRNDKMYRQGRAMLDESGKELRPHDKRAMRAIDAKSSYGALLEHTSWLMYEYTTLQQLYKAGVSVPEPIGAGENAILMSYHGDSSLAAPTLNSVALDRSEAVLLFKQVIDTIELMLGQNLIHGDLSAYNILYEDGEIVFIDFPQVVNSQANEEAEFILRRDVIRVCDYFIGQGVDCDPDAIVDGMWHAYLDVGNQNREADISRITEAMEEVYED